MNSLDMPDRLRTAPAQINGGKILARTYAAAEAAGRAAYAGWQAENLGVTDCSLKALTDAVARAAVEAVAADLREEGASAPRAVRAERERELLDLKGPCRVSVCRLHYAHAGPCDIANGARR